jgi:hypothetical protein
VSALKSYLGDSVYADFDGYSVHLTTENGNGPNNRIVLEPDILSALNRYYERVSKPPVNHPTDPNDTIP